MRVDEIISEQRNKVYKSILLRQAYRDENGKCKHKTYANLSDCDPAEIKAIKLALKYKGELQILGSLKDIKSTRGISVGVIVVVYEIAKRIGITAALGSSRLAKLLLWLVIARLVGQGSRLSAARLAQSHAALEVLRLEAFCEDDLYNAMDWADDFQDTIEKKLFRTRWFDKKVTLFLYDVTSSYLEGVQNFYGAYGHNRDKKTGKQQIVVGLMTDPCGIPVSIHVYPGNTSDVSTFEDQVKKVCNRFHVTDVTFVGDRGMIKSGGIDALRSHGFHYITAITKAQIKSLVKKGVFQMTLFDEKVCEINDGGIRLILRKNPIRAQEIHENRSQREDVLRAFVEMKNVYLSEHPRAKVSVALKHIRKKGWRLKVNSWLKAKADERNIIITKDTQSLEKAGLFDGCYVLKTDLPSDKVNKETVHERYKDLGLVEDAFKDMKTEHLEIRPLYVRTKEHTRAHAFITMLAYMIRYELEKCWKPVDHTVQECLDILAQFSSLIMEHNEQKVQIIPKPNTITQELIKLAEVEFPEILPYRKKDKYTKRKLPSRRKKHYIYEVTCLFFCFYMKHPMKQERGSNMYHHDSLPLSSIQENKLRKSVFPVMAIVFKGDFLFSQSQYHILSVQWTDWHFWHL